MKHIFLFCLLLASSGIKAQSIKTSEIKTSESINLVESIESVNIFKGKQLYLKIFKVANASSSANLSESDEISHDLILSIAQYDEYPETKVFKIGPFLNPIIKKKVDQGKSILFLVDGTVPNSMAKKSYRITVSEKAVQVE